MVRVFHLLSEAVYLPMNASSSGSSSPSSSFLSSFISDPQALKQYKEQSVQKKTEFYREGLCRSFPKEIRKTMRKMDFFVTGTLSLSP
jgi:hypothetical protein